MGDLVLASGDRLCLKCDFMVSGFSQSFQTYLLGMSEGDVLQKEKRKKKSREKCKPLSWDLEMLSLQTCECGVSYASRILSSDQEPPGKSELGKRL